VKEVRSTRTGSGLSQIWTDCFDDFAALERHRGLEPLEVLEPSIRLSLESRKHSTDA